jgi:hypothetical protein
MADEIEMVDARPLFLKRMIWDIFSHDSDIAEVQRRLGLVPDQPDGLEMAHAESDARIAMIQPLIRPSSLLTHYIAEVMGVYLVMSLEAHAGRSVELPDDFYESFAEQNQETIFLGSMALIAHMMDAGVLAYASDIKKKAAELRNNGE